VPGWEPIFGLDRRHLNVPYLTAYIRRLSFDSTIGNDWEIGTPSMDMHAKCFTFTGRLIQIPEASSNAALVHIWSRDHYNFECVIVNMEIMG
jgi:hypothetical protein